VQISSQTPERWPYGYSTSPICQNGAFGKPQQKFLLKFSKGDDRKVDPASSISIDKETIIHQILLTDEYSIAFESIEEFDGRVDASVQQANLTNTGKIKFELDQTTRKRIVANVDDGKEYLVALKSIDWDDF
jgi:hypothetical protein